MWKFKTKYAIFALAFFLVLIPDRFTKWLVGESIRPGESIVIIPGLFDLVNLRNRGAAFGFLNRSDIEWQFWLFLFATIAAAVVIYVILRGIRNQPILALGLGLILGGAAGNLVDRLQNRSVLDFMDFYWRSWHWPAFNIADMGICIGAFLACVATWKKNTERAA